MLEQQQERLVNCIWELYARSINSGSWTGAPLQNTSEAYPATRILALQSFWWDRDLWGEPRCLPAWNDGQARGEPVRHTHHNTVRSQYYEQSQIWLIFDKWRLLRRTTSSYASHQTNASMAQSFGAGLDDLLQWFGYRYNNAEHESIKYIHTSELELTRERLWRCVLQIHRSTRYFKRVAADGERLSMVGRGLL